MIVYKNSYKILFFADR